MLLSRRWFMRGLIAAPAVVLAERLMPVRAIGRLFKPSPYLTLYDVAGNVLQRFGYVIGEDILWGPLDEEVTVARAEFVQHGVSQPVQLNTQPIRLLPHDSLRLHLSINIT